jgi:LPS-assembly protein
LVEPYATYRRITGIGQDFPRIIRFDEVDTVADTSEFEYGLVNRFFVTRPGDDGESPVAHELLAIKLAQKYFFDPDFGGALVFGRRNQFDPINTLSGSSFGGTPRRFSPIHAAARLRPLSSLFADVRLDYDTRERAMRTVSLGVGIQREHVSLSQAWYLVRRLRLRSGVFEPGVAAGNIHQSSFTIGNRARGWFGGVDITYDFHNRFGRLSRGRVLSSTLGIGYAADCCTLQLQNTVFRVGFRSENRLAVSLTLNGLGSFGRHTSGGQQIFGQ